MSGRPCLLCATIFDNAIKKQDCSRANAGKTNPTSHPFGALAAGDKHLVEALEFVKILHGLATKQDGLALFTRDKKSWLRRCFRKPMIYLGRISFVSSVA